MTPCKFVSGKFKPLKVPEDPVVTMQDTDHWLNLNKQTIETTGMINGGGFTEEKSFDFIVFVSGLCSSPHA